MYKKCTVKPIADDFVVVLAITLHPLSNFICITLNIMIPGFIKNGNFFMMVFILSINSVAVSPIFARIIAFFSELNNKYHNRNIEEVIVLPLCLGLRNILNLLF